MLVLQMERETQRLSRAALSRKAAVQPNLIGWIETGRFKPYDSQLTKIAAALDWQDEPDKLLEQVEA